MDIAGIILAGGWGRRMKSRTPKVLHKLSGKPLIYYPIKLLRAVGIKKIMVVYRNDRVRKTVELLDKEVILVHQLQPLGTASAVGCALPKIKESTTLVLNGDDSAFYTPATIKKVISTHQKNQAQMTFVTLKVSDPTGFGRVVRDKDGRVVGIIEEKIATEEQKKNREINDGCYVFDTKWLKHNIVKVPKSAAGEYYLTRLVDIGAANGAKIATFTLENSNEWFGIDTKEKLRQANTKKGPDTQDLLLV